MNHVPAALAASWFVAVIPVQLFALQLLLKELLEQATNQQAVDCLVVNVFD